MGANLPSLGWISSELVKISENGNETGKKNFPFFRFLGLWNIYKNCA